MSAEVWFPVVGWEEEYAVSTDLRVQSLRRKIIRSNNSPMTVRDRVLTPMLVKGSPTVILTRHGRPHHRTISSLLRDAQEAAL
jgi:NUMOD4 motif